MAKLFGNSLHRKKAYLATLKLKKMFLGKVQVFNSEIVIIGDDNTASIWNRNDGSTGGNSATVVGNTLKFMWGGSGEVWIHAKTKETVDVTGYDKFVFTVTQASKCTRYVRIIGKSGTVYHNKSYGIGTHTVDISAINEPVYFRISCFFSFMENGTDPDGDGKLNWETGYFTISKAKIE